jgi:hypothetical protein
MPLPDPSQNALLTAVVAFFVGSGPGTCWAVIERIRSAKKADQAREKAEVASETRAEVEGLRAVIAVKDEIISALQEEHAQYLKYREEHHAKLEKDNAKMLALTEENALLRSRSDLSPILEQMRAIQDTSKSMMESLQMLTEKVHSLCDFHEDERRTNRAA